MDCTICFTESINYFCPHRQAQVRGGGMLAVHDEDWGSAVEHFVVARNTCPEVFYKKLF